MLDCDPEIHIICFCVQLKWLIWAIPKSEPFFRPFSLFKMLYEWRQGIGAIIVPARWPWSWFCFSTWVERDVIDPWIEAWPEDKMWRLCIYLLLTSIYPIWSDENHWNVRKSCYVMVLCWEGSERQSLMVAASQMEKTPEHRCHWHLWSICFFSVILICLRFHSQITDVRFHHFRRLRWVHLLSLGGVVFVINGQYCFFLLLLLISTRSSTYLLDIGLSAKMHNLPYQFIWILFNHHDLKLCERELSVLVLVGELEHLIDVGLGHRHR